MADAEGERDNGIHQPEKLLYTEGIEDTSRILYIPSCPFITADIHSILTTAGSLAGKPDIHDKFHRSHLVKRSPVVTCG